MAESQPGTSTKATDDQTQTLVVDETSEQSESPPVLHLRLQQPKNEQKVKWTTDTVDNEFMGKKKSKCCCIYEKPKVFGESDTSSSSSDDDDDDKGCTPHCRGHKKKCYRHQPQGKGHQHDHNHDHCHDHNGAHDNDAGSCDSNTEEDIVCGPVCKIHGKRKCE